MKYNYITIKLRLLEIKKEEFNGSNKLFNDYQRKQELINQLQQKYSLIEGEKCTFFPIINNYIIKFNNPCIINNKYAVTEYNNNILTKKNSFSNYKNNTFNISNKTFDFKAKEKNRYNKSKKIKRVKLINYNNNSKKYIIVPKKNNFINNNNFKFSKTEANLYKANKREITLKSLIQEEKIKNKKMSKKLSCNTSNKNMNKILNSLFNSDKDKRIKTESSFILTRDESNILSDKSNNNFKFQAESSSSYDNINLLLKRINDQKIRQIKDYKNINESGNKIVKIDIRSSKDKIDNKIMHKIDSFNNNNKKLPISKEINKSKKIFPYKKINIIKIHPQLKKINLNEVLKNLKNSKKNIIIKSGLISNYNRTQINNEETTQTSGKEIFKNISFEIKKEKILKNNKEIKNEFIMNESNKKDEGNISIQSLSDSKVLEIANTFIDERIDKIQISDILTHKKKQNQNSTFQK